MVYHTFRADPLAVLERQFLFAAHDMATSVAGSRRIPRVDGDEVLAVQCCLIVSILRNIRQPLSWMLIARAWFFSKFWLRSSSAATRSWFLINAVEVRCRKFLWHCMTFAVSLATSKRCFSTFFASRSGRCSFLARTIRRLSLRCVLASRHRSSRRSSQCQSRRLSSDRFSRMVHRSRFTFY